MAELFLCRVMCAPDFWVLCTFLVPPIPGGIEIHRYKAGNRGISGGACLGCRLDCVP